jgi:hypothetical protein
VAVTGTLTTTGNTILGDATTDTLNVGAGGLVKDASGNVGIGTSSVRNATLVNALNGYTASNNGAVTPYFQWYNANAGTDLKTWRVGSNSGILIFETVNDAYSSATERMRIDAIGNVGIGTSSPGSKLTVGGNPPTSGAIAGVGASGGISLALSDNVNNSLYVKHVSGGATIGTDPGGQLAFATNGFTEAMRIDGSGNVLIGGSTTAAGPVILAKGGAAGGSIIQFFKPNSGATNVILNYYVATYVGGMNMDNTSTSFITSSDIRLKKDIVDAPSATQKIDDIKIVSHGWKHDKAVVDFGIIAQDLYEIMPRAVTKGDDNEEVETVWSVDYSKLVPMLIKAHQEQQAIINQLQADVATLKGLSA